MEYKNIFIKKDAEMRAKEQLHIENVIQPQAQHMDFKIRQENEQFQMALFEKNKKDDFLKNQHKNERMKTRNKVLEQINERQMINDKIRQHAGHESFKTRTLQA